LNLSVTGGSPPLNCRQGGAISLTVNVCLSISRTCSTESSWT
jgi:hypothetical protein